MERKKNAIDESTIAPALFVLREAEDLGASKPGNVKNDQLPGVGGSQHRSRKLSRENRMRFCRVVQGGQIIPSNLHVEVPRKNTGLNGWPRMINLVGGQLVPPPSMKVWVKHWLANVGVLDTRCQRNNAPVLSSFQRASCRADQHHSISTRADVLGYLDSRTRATYVQ